MLYLPFLILFMACSPKAIKATEDAIEGEIKVVEEVMTDLAHDQHKRPCIEFTVLKF